MTPWAAYRQEVAYRRAVHEIFDPWRIEMRFGSFWRSVWRRMRR